MKKLYVYIITALLLIFFCSCSGQSTNSQGDFSEIDRDLPEAQQTAEEERYTVTFEENEAFAEETERRAAQFIDPYIKQAVEIMNSVDREETQYEVLDFDYSSLPKMRDSLADPLSCQIYDTILAAAVNYGDYFFHEDDYSTDNFFALFSDAADALRTDHRYIYLYTDTAGGWKTYEDGYYMPGSWLDNMTDDREAIKAEVEYFDRVVDRIIGKMPQNLTNHEKCLYFTFIISVVGEYDYSLASMPNYYQPYDMLIKQKAVCKGYAETFYLLCKRAGIACYICNGTAGDGFHAWNRIDTQQGPVYMDLTWYDSDELTDDYRQGDYSCLFMTQTQLADTGHITEQLIQYP